MGGGPEPGGIRGFFITGRPGVGKTTIFMRVVEELRRVGCVVGGIYAPEVRAGGRRVGFKVVDLHSGEWGWLARAGLSGPGPRVGRYTVIVEDVLKVGVSALEWAISNAHLVAVDEIGPMELAVPELRASIKASLRDGKLLLAVVHRRLKNSDPDIYGLVSSLGRVIEVNELNRSDILGRAREVALGLSREAKCGR